MGGKYMRKPQIFFSISIVVVTILLLYGCLPSAPTPFSPIVSFCSNDITPVPCVITPPHPRFLFVLIEDTQAYQDYATNSYNVMEDIFPEILLHQVV